MTTKSNKAQQKILKKSPKKSTKYYKKALRLKAKGKIISAYKCFNQAIMCNPWNEALIDKQYDLVKTASNISRSKEFKLTVKLCINSILVLRGLIILRESKAADISNKKNKQESTNSTITDLIDEPITPISEYKEYSKLGDIFAKLHLYIKSIKMYKKSIKIYKNPEVLYKLSKIQMAVRPYESHLYPLLSQSLNTLEEAIYLKPLQSSCYKYFTRLSKAVMKLKRPQLSIYFKRVALALSPNQNSLSTFMNMLKKSSKDGIQKLNRLVGLKDVKSYIKSLANQAEIYSIRSGHKGHKEMHLVFTGNPGTGKTTVANLFCDILYQKHIIKRPVFKKIDLSVLRHAEHHWNAGILMNRAIKEALGGVLFIDEAYQLDDSNPTDGAGRDITISLIKGIEAHKDDLVVILAGYTGLMNHLLNNTNPGLRSRFPLSSQINFPDYSDKECFEIFNLYLKQHKFKISSKRSKQLLRQGLRKALDTIREHSPSTFGNARTVRNIFDDLITIQANRLESKYTYKELIDYKKNKPIILNTITYTDIKTEVKNLKHIQRKMNKHKIGFN